MRRLMGEAPRSRLAACPPNRGKTNCMMSTRGHPGSATRESNVPRVPSDSVRAVRGLRVQVKADPSFAC